MDHTEACTVDNTIRHIAYFIREENINASIGKYVLMADGSIDIIREMLGSVVSDTTSDYLCIPIGLGADVFHSTLTHANWICFDVKKDALYRCEPLGSEGVCTKSITKSNTFMNQLGKRWTDHIDFDIQGPNDSCRVMSTLVLKDLLLKGTLLKRHKEKRNAMSTNQQEKENHNQKAYRADFNIPRDTRRQKNLFLFHHVCPHLLG
jgi:hypothetical protein